MSDTSRFPEQLRRILEPTERGIVGLVDDLLGLCRETGLRLVWRNGFCRVRPLGVEPNHATEISLGKSVFRAMLARIAALCNERTPNSVSPYGGEGELSTWTNPPAVFHVAFTNTPDEQWLEVSHVSDGKVGATVDDAALDVRPSSRSDQLRLTS
jgi:hypothetical protein